MKNIIEELNNKICVLNNFINSNFINEKDYLLLEEGIWNKMNKIISKKRLIYKASKKSFRVNDFHKQCDGKSNTVTFILTNKGKKFGAFADQEWDSFSSLKKGNNGFVFSLDDKEIYYNIDGYNIFCNSTYGPCFGKGVVIYDNNSEIEERCMDESHISFDTKGKQYALAGCLKFFVEDIEIYELILEDI